MSPWKHSYGAILALLLAGMIAAPGQSKDDKDEEGMEEGRPAVIGEPAPPIRIRTQGNKSKPEDLIEKNRRNVVVLFFFRTTDPASVDAFAEVKKISDDLRSKGVVVLAISDEKKEKVDPFLKSKKYDGAVIYNAYFPYPYNVPAPPRVYLIDPDGILANHFHPADNLDERIRTQMQRTPPAASNSDALRARFERANKHLEDGDVGRAVTLAREVESLAGKDNPIGGNAKKLREKIDEAAKKQFQEARAKVTDKKPEEAISTLAMLSVRFAGSQIGSDADAEIGRVMSDREMKPKMRTAIENAKGEVLIDQADEHESGGRYVEAIRIHRDVVERHENTEAAKKSEAAIDRINSDPKAQAEIAARRSEAEAERWLDIAERFERVGMYGKAREYLELIREKHPDSRAAAKAPDRLKALPKDEGDDDVGDASEVQPDEPSDDDKGES